MASTIQIVPRYQHSHVETFIYDNTFYTDERSTEVDDSVKFIAVFTSGKGIDNKFVKKTNLKSFTETFGKSNPKKYGQPLMMPIAELNTGVASVYAMRVMPLDAAYANAALYAYYKADVDGKLFTVKFGAKSFSGDNKVLSEQDLEAKALVLDSEDSLDGWTQVPILTFRSMGRGEYGQNYRWRITSNMDYERDYQKKIFTFEILSTENGLNKEKQYAGTLVPNENEDEALNINDVIESYDVGDYPVKISVFEENVQAIYDAYVAFLKTIATADESVEVTVPEVDEFDLFFGNEIAVSTTPVAYKYYKVLGSADDASAIDLSNASGNSFNGGTDGSFSGDADAVEAAINQAYIDAFSGTTDKTILSPRRIPCDALLDANYAFEVKKALATLALARNDCLCYIDAGVINSLSSPNFTNLKNKYSGLFQTREISLNLQHYQVRDYHTKRRTDVTITYLFAQLLPEHFKNYGKHIPFVKSYAELSGHLKNTLQPSVEMWEDDLKEELYLGRFNYFEAIGENQFQRACQNTAQAGNSDLLEENNVHTLFDIKRILEYDAWANSYNFTSQDERSRFQQIEEAKFSNWKGRKVDTISIRFDVTEWESERSILHCYAEVQFRNLTKRTIIEIDVNKRNFLA